MVGFETKNNKVVFYLYVLLFFYSKKLYILQRYTK